MKPIKPIAIFIFLLVLSVTAFSQKKQTQELRQVWTGYFNQTRFSNKWGAWLDLQLRTKEDFFSQYSQAIIRPGLTYYVNDALKLTAGYAYISHFPADNHAKITMPEHRPWQQVQWHTKYTRNRTMQWLRLEERFRRKILNDSMLAEGNNFNFRLRYNILWQVPLTPGQLRKGSLSFILNDEVHFNLGSEIVTNHFDQNRFFAGLSWQLSGSGDNLQVGYMNLFQQLPAVARYRSIHAARLFYFHNLDLRGKK